MKVRKVWIAAAATVLLCALLAVSASAAAVVDAGNCGDLTWILYDDGTLAITGRGPMPDYSSYMESPPWGRYRELVYRVDIQEGVTHIGTDAFSGFQALSSVAIADSVTTIGSCAFEGCTALRSLSVPDSVTAIGDAAFCDCSSLRSVTMSGVTTFGTSVFCGCSSLTDVVIGAGVTYIGMSAFEDCTSLTSVTLPEGIDSIGSYVFESCIALPSVIMPDSVTFIGSSAFEGCASLKDIYIPAGVTVIGSYAFAGCPSLSSITFSGDLPTLSWNCLEGVAGTCYYPADNPTWTAEAMQDYGGSPVWVAGADVRPKITLQPAGVTTTSSGRAVFTLNAVGEGLSYQWQYRKNASDSWKSASASGSKTATLTIDPAASYRNGYQYRCKVSNAGGTVYSEVVTLTIRTVAKPVITAGPKRVNTTADGKAVFSVTAAGEDLSYQWQYRKNSSDSWKSASATGSKTATLTINPAASYRSGYQYRCKVSNGGGTVYSGYATLVIKTVAKPVITGSPKRVNTTADGKAVFSVTATGEGLSYQWQYRKNSSDSWKSASATGSKTATLTINPAAAYRSGYQYRCKVTNAGGTVYSGYATLTIKTAKPVITAQPVSRTVGANDSVTFYVTAAGAASYQWQYKPAGSTKWLNNSCTDSTFTIDPAKAFRDGYQYRCKVTNSGGTVYSAAATLTVK